MEKDSKGRILLATADELVNQIDFLLENCILSKKNDNNDSFDISDIRPKLLKTRDSYIKFRNKII